MLSGIRLAAGDLEGGGAGLRGSFNLIVHFGGHFLKSLGPEGALGSLRNGAVEGDCEVRFRPGCPAPDVGPQTRQGLVRGLALGASPGEGDGEGGLG